jgi:nitronate monooxygenase
MALSPILANLPLPIIGAPLFIVSNPKLVIAQCTAGIVGSMPALNARPAEQLEQWLAEITEALASGDRNHPDRPAAPFAINQIVHKSNDRLEHDMQVCAKYKVPIIITSLGARTDVNDAVHAWGGVVMHDSINNAFATLGRRRRSGCAAGRRPCGSQARSLVQEIRRWFDGPIALSGAIANVRRARCRRWPTWPTSARHSSPPRKRARLSPKQCIVEWQRRIVLELFTECMTT